MLVWGQQNKAEVSGFATLIMIKQFNQSQLFSHSSSYRLQEQVGAARYQNQSQLFSHSSSYLLQEQVGAARYHNQSQLFSHCTSYLLQEQVGATRYHNCGHKSSNKLGLLKNVIKIYNKIIKIFLNNLFLSLLNQYLIIYVPK